jgi:hypothetical protein
MIITEHQSQVRTIRSGDPNFMINDGFVTTPRAMLHVLPECPNYVRDIIQTASAQGWIKSVANVTERELIFMGLTKND